MQTEVTRKRFNVDEYYRMVDAGILCARDRVELIEGEIIEMSPIGSRHAACVDRALDLFTAAFRGRAIVTVQHPLRLNRYNEPQPDLAVLKPRADYYASQSRTPADTFFIVEVSDTSFRYDTKVKLPIYAQAGVPELWIENLREDLIIVFREPSAKTYTSQVTRRRGESVSPLAFPDVVFPIDELLR
jgi:Uma2 family endonuclease